MKPAPFKYYVPESIEEALSIKERLGDDAKFLAGGQSLIPTMNFRLAQPENLIDLNRLADCGYIRRNADGSIAIGALARHRQLEHDDLIRREQPLVHEAIQSVAHPQIRNRGTLCGNLAHADPASEMPAVMLALNARMHLRSSSGDRWVLAQDFFVSVFTTALEENELLVEVELPAMPESQGTCFLEVARRRGDYAMMGIAATVGVESDGTCSDLRLVFCGAGETPILAENAMQAALGQRITGDKVQELSTLVEEELDPPGTVHASAAFQSHLAGVLTKRAVTQALARVG